MLSRILEKLTVFFRRKRRRKKYMGIYRRVMNYTMVDPTYLVDNLEIFDLVQNLEGDIVECGVWRGGMSAAMAFHSERKRHFYLFDSFEGLPEPKEIDGEAANNWALGLSPEIYWDNCKAEESYAATIMASTGIPFTLVKGWFQETLPGFEFPREIALLRLDGDWYESTITCLNSLYPKVCLGGVIIIDDYYTWDGCCRAVHDYLSSIGSVTRIQRSQNGVAYLIKRDKNL